jgi:hypothetical protein
MKAIARLVLSVIILGDFSSYGVVPSAKPRIVFQSATTCRSGGMEMAAKWGRTTYIYEYETRNPKHIQNPNSR